MNEQQNDDMNLTASMEKASQPGYINSLNGVQALLGEIVTVITHAVEEDKQLSDVTPPVIDRITRILLGEDPSRHPQAGWNAPGGIDEWLREHRLTQASDPGEAVRDVLTQFVFEFIEAIKYAATEGVSEELARSNVEVLMTRYTYLFLGVEMPEENAEEE